MGTDGYRSRRGSAGFKYGVGGAILMIVVHLFFLLIFRGTNNGDLLAMFLSWFVYFMVGRGAAQSQYNSQRESINPLRGVKDAGLGAGLIASLIIWGYIIVRGVFRDVLGIPILSEPVGLFCSIVIDVAVAMGLGRLGGYTVEKKYRGLDHND